MKNWSAWRVVFWLGAVPLAADMVYEGSHLRATVERARSGAEFRHTVRP